MLLFFILLVVFSYIGKHDFLPGNGKALFKAKAVCFEHFLNYTFSINKCSLDYEVFLLSRATDCGITIKPKYQITVALKGSY